MERIVGRIKEIIPKLLELDNDKYYICDIKEPKSKRSLEQNRFLWKLIHSLAHATNHEDMEIYCSALERADAKSEYLITAYDLEEDLRKSFRSVKFVRKQDVNGKECNVYKVYLGSSKMDTKEMTELLEIVIQMCTENGVPTMEDYE